jgi:hypothetical protein
VVSGPTGGGKPVGGPKPVPRGNTVARTYDALLDFNLGLKRRSEEAVRQLGKLGFVHPVAKKRAEHIIQILEGASK